MRLLLPLALLVRLAAADDPDAPPPPERLASSTDQPPPPATAVVTANHDGDTVTLNTGDRVRLRWVNTPEIAPGTPEPYAVEARDLTRTLTVGKQVTLLYGRTVRDSYGRLLAGIEADGVNLSVALLEAGLGHLFVIPPDDTDLRPFIAAQEKARQARRGIWSSPGFQGVLHMTSFHANADGDDRSNVNGEYIRVCNVSTAPVDLSGFRIADISGNSWELPAVVVPAGHTFKIHSGKGANETDPARQIEVYLQSADPIWNNDLDRATIYDKFGRMVDTRTHEVQGKK